MAFVVAYEGEVLLLKRMLNQVATDDVRLHLYTNNQNPSPNDTIGNYVESVAAGYASVVLSGGSWAIATAGGLSSAIYSRQTFTFTAPDTINGYYITNNNSTTLLVAEKFASAFTLPVGGGIIDIDPSVSLI